MKPRRSATTERFYSSKKACQGCHGYAINPCCLLLDGLNGKTGALC